MLKDKLRQARKAAGLTQKEVAERIGVVESTYCGYETGKRQPDPIKISAIAAVLGVSGDFLLEIDNEEAVKKPAIVADRQEENEEIDIEITEWDKRYLAWLHSQSPEKRRAILILQDAPEDLL